MLRTILAAAAAAIIGASALAADKAPKEAMDFANSVASATAFEIQSSQLAQKNAKSAEVKAFADQMIADHTKAAGELKKTLKGPCIIHPKVSMGVKDLANYANSHLKNAIIIVP